MSTAAHLVPIETELKLLEIWQAVLEPPSIGLDDDFLELGGDSISAVMCISRIRKLFGYDLEIDDFFLDGATIRRFARSIDAADAGKSGASQEAHDGNIDTP
jgi:acyl carrier protein